METDYSSIINQYPPVITMDQMYRICHISKRKAKWLLENGIIPCKDSGKKTRRFKINTIDVVYYLQRRERHPEEVQTPIGLFNSGYSSHGKKKPNPITPDIPKDESNCFFCVESHPAVLDGFIDQARKAWQDLGLFDISHCESEAEGEINYSGKVVVIDPHQLKDAYKAADDQLFLATGGFGCSPNSRGRKVFGEFLKDGEKTYYFRSDILGVLKSEYLPQWAFEKPNPDTVMDASYEPASEAPAMTGM